MFRPGGPRAGDVVVVSVPGSTERVVKRVVALAGQVVAMHEGALLIDGELATTAAVPSRFASFTSFAAVEVEEDHVYVLGDNRLPLASRDSRDFGPVGLTAVRGRVVLPPTGL
jgi:signal peptidase I